MCRHVARLGTPVPLSAVVLDEPHGLLQQSWAPRRQRYGTVNADGFGAGWYADGRLARYRRNVPLWADPSFASLAQVVSSGCVLAAVRTATVGQPLDESACAPFVLPGDVLLSHNGMVPQVAQALGDLVTSAELAAVGSTVDSAFVAALVAARLGDGLAEALRGAVETAAARAPGARLNLLATDGVTVAATAWGDTLCWRAMDGAVVVASEPSDEADDWHDVPDRSLLTATPDGVAVVPLGEDLP